MSEHTFEEASKHLKEFLEEEMSAINDLIEDLRKNASYDDEKSRIQMLGCLII